MGHYNTAVNAPNPTIAAPATIAFHAETDEAELLVVCAAAVLEGVDPLLDSLGLGSPEDDDVTPGEEAGGVVPELESAFCLNAAAVMSPLVGGLTERTMPDRQSPPTDEKNLSEE